MRKNQTNDNVFTKEDDISFYLLGAFITDGNIYVNNKGHHQISITSADKIWIEDMRQLIVPTAKIIIKKNCFTLKFTNEIIKNWLVSYGYTPKKSNTVKLEREIPKRYIFDFLRGVIDGDGCICASHYTKQLKSGIKNYQTLSLYITTGSKLFGEQLLKLIEPVCSCVLYTKRRKEVIMKNGKIIKPTTYWYVQSGKKDIKNFLDKTYYKNNKLNLERKQKIVDQYCRSIDVLL